MVVVKCKLTWMTFGVATGSGMRRVLFPADCSVCRRREVRVDCDSAGKPEPRIRELVEQVGWDVLYNDDGMFKEPSMQRATSAVTCETDPVIALRKMLTGLPSVSGTAKSVLKPERIHPVVLTCAPAVSGG